jgi:hypothetical protein
MTCAVKVTCASFTWYEVKPCCAEGTVLDKQEACTQCSEKEELTLEALQRERGWAHCYVYNMNRNCACKSPQ